MTTTFLPKQLLVRVMEDIPVYIKIRLKPIKIINKRYCRKLYLFLAHMDIGYWIRSFQIHYLRAKGLSGYIISLEYSQVIYWNYLLLYGRLLLLVDEAIYYFKWI